MRKNACTMFDAAAFGIGRRIIEPGDARLGNRACAHRARFKRHPQIAIIEAVGVEGQTRSADCDDFGMSRRIIARACPIATGCNDLAIADNDSTDRNFAERFDLFGNIERVAHGIGQWKRHHTRLADDRRLTKAAFAISGSRFPNHRTFRTYHDVAHLRIDRQGSHGWQQRQPRQ
jgi:hypothetical protein